MNMDFLRKMTAENFVLDKELLQTAQQIKQVDDIAEIIEENKKVGKIVTEDVIKKELVKKQQLQENNDFFDDMPVAPQKKKIIPKEKGTYKEPKFDDSKFTADFVKKKLQENIVQTAVEPVSVDAIKAMLEGKLSKVKETLVPAKKEQPRQLIQEQEEEEYEYEAELPQYNPKNVNIKEQVKDCVYDILFDEILSKDRIKNIIRETMKEEIEKGVKAELQRLLSKKKS